MQYSSEDLEAAWQGIKNMASINRYANENQKSICVNGVDNSDLHFWTLLTLSFPALRGLISLKMSFCVKSALSL